VVFSCLSLEQAELETGRAVITGRKAGRVAATTKEAAAAEMAADERAGGEFHKVARTKAMKRRGDRHSKGCEELKMRNWSLEEVQAAAKP
jgi:hypothetical protein